MTFTFAIVFQAGFQSLASCTRRRRQNSNFPSFQKGPSHGGFRSNQNNAKWIKMVHRAIKNEVPLIHSVFHTCTKFVFGVAIRVSRKHTTKGLVVTSPRPPSAPRATRHGE